MELKNFQINVLGKGTINVDFTLHFNDYAVSIGEIKLHADFGSELPHHPQLTLHDNVWRLYVQQPVMQNNEIVVVDKYLTDDISNDIVKKLLQIKEEANVR